MEAEHDVENYDEYPDEDGRVDENQSEVEAPPRDILMEETAEENGGEPSQQVKGNLHPLNPSIRLKDLPSHSYSKTWPRAKQTRQSETSACKAGRTPIQ
jgi:hypothetical protein